MSQPPPTRRYHLVAHTSDGHIVEVDLTARDAAMAVSRLVELVRHGYVPNLPHRDSRRLLERVHAQPVADTPRADDEETTS